MSSDDIGDQCPTNALRSGSVDAKAAVSHVDDEGRIPALPGKSGTERDVHGDSLLSEDSRGASLSASAFSSLTSA